MTEEINNMINKFCDSVEKRISQYELEKENAELKSYSQRMENQRENYYKEYLRLEQENKILKSNTNVLNDYITKNEQLKTNIDYLVKINESLKQELNELKVFDSARQEVLKEYKKALEEIKNDLKEICKEECDYTKAKFCGDCDCRYGQILDKINGVLK